MLHAGASLTPLEPVLLHALQQDGTPRALYGVLSAMHTALARHSAVAIAEAAPRLHAAMPRLIAEYVILAGKPRPADQSAAAVDGPGEFASSVADQDMDAVLPLLGTMMPQSLAPLLACLTELVPVRGDATFGNSNTDNARVAALPLVVRALAAAQCLQCILAAEEVRLALVGEEGAMMHLIEVLADVQSDAATTTDASALKALCGALRKTAQDAFGRGLQ